MAVRVEVEGVQPLLKRIREFEDKTVTKAVNKSAADVVLDEADPNTPQRSGGLRRSGRTSGTQTAGVVRYGNSRIPYARNRHFGDPDRVQGGFVRPDPWVYDAADRRRDEVFEVYERRVRELSRRLF